MSQRTFLRIALAALLAQTGIVITGGVVRLSNSGLGCPTWPRCSGDSLLPGTGNPHPGLNQAIEYTNRTLTGVLMAIGALCVLGAYRTHADRTTKLLAWVQPAGVFAQGILGGITVLVDLHPAAVGSHFMLSMAVIAATWIFYLRVKGSQPEVMINPPAYFRYLRAGLVTSAVVLLVIGTVVTGAGPHAGDDESPRYGFAISAVTQLHADFVFVTIGLTLALLGFAAAKGENPRLTRAVRDLLIIELAQGVLGYVQYALSVPAVLVGFHIAGACLVWLAVLRVATTVSLRPADYASRASIADASRSTAPSL